MLKEYIVKIKKIFSENKISLELKIFLISFFTFFAIVLILTSLLWYFRPEVSSFLSRHYFREVDMVNNNYILEDKSGDIISQGENYTVVDAVKKAEPAVVSILIYKEVPIYETYYDNNNQMDPFGGFFPDFFFQTPQYRQKGTERKQVGSGSGFLINKDGLIVTNRHVVSQEDVEYKVILNNGKEYTASVLAKDSVLDVALIKINVSNLPYLEFGNSDNLDIGQSVIAIGNALGEFKNSVSVGVVSGLSRSITAGDNFGQREFLDKVIQTDAAINPGNSGGPLLNLKGEVIGINVAVVQGSSNIGFALPINSVKPVIDSVLATGKIIRPYVGIRYVPINAEVKRNNDLTVDYGILVIRGRTQSELAVIPGSPADKAGIVENDIILEVDGRKINKDGDFAVIIRSKKVGDIINLKMLSKGVEKKVSVRLEAAPDGN